MALVFWEYIDFDRRHQQNLFFPREQNPKKPREYCDFDQRHQQNPNTHVLGFFWILSKISRKQRKSKKSTRKCLIQSFCKIFGFFIFGFPWQLIISYASPSWGSNINTFQSNLVAQSWVYTVRLLQLRFVSSLPRYAPNHRLCDTVLGGFVSFRSQQGHGDLRWFLCVIYII